MKSSRLIAAFLLIATWSGLLLSQQPATAPSGVVPQLVNFSGKVVDAQGKTIAGIAGVTFAIYKDQYEGAPLWTETQNVTADSKGNYTVQLGAATASGLPLDLFSSGEARWLGVRINGGEEQSRVLLLSVPYALKAADAQTLGGLPASAFVLAAPVNANAAAASANSLTAVATSAAPPPASSDVTTTGGTVNAIPLFSTATNIQNSILTQNGTTGVFVGGRLSFPAIAAATATAGKNSRPEAFVASAFNSGTAAAVPQTFLLQAEPAGNDTATPSGTLNLLYGSGTTTPAETGLKISSKGLLTFATGQTFPGTGGGTVTSVGSGAGLTGGPITGSGTLSIATGGVTNAMLTNPSLTVTAGTAMTGGGAVALGGSATLNVDTTKVPLLAANNTFTGNNVFNVSADADAIDAYTSGPGKTALVGLQYATSGGSYGVYAFTHDPTGAGVAGINKSSSGNSVGVFGQSDSDSAGAGLFGQNGSESATGLLLIGAGVGTWGDAGRTIGSRGVVGTADDGSAGYFVNNSPRGYVTLFAGSENSATDPFYALGAGECAIDSSGNLSCSGTKNAMVPVDGGKRAVAMSAIESPVNWFEDAGSAHLVNGVAVVELDPTFIQTVNTGMDYKVFPVANGDCNGLYVTNKTATSFEVRELLGGTSSVAFDYRIMALRKNYENVRSMTAPA